MRLDADWTLLYSLDQHGASLSTLYSRVDAGMRFASNTGCVVVVRDGDEAVFGAYVSEGLKRSDSYYGTGERSVAHFLQCMVASVNILLQLSMARRTI